MRRWYGVPEILVLLHMVVAPALAQSPKREMRAVWLATVGGLDWPRSISPAAQQSSLQAMFDTLRLNRFNTVVFQVRARGNAFYNSAYEPWAGELTGDDSANLGVVPDYDPLQYAITLARQRGMELHAWFNFAIAWKNTVAPISQDLTKPHVGESHPEWTKTYGGDLWLDPGIPDVRAYLRDVALDLIRNYDIDGIHFDYIRVANTNFPDDDTFVNPAYTNDSSVAGKPAWRRENMNLFMREFYDSVAAIKPWVKVGSAPLGVYQPIPNYAPSTFYGMAMGQDARQWMLEGKHDYVMPQIYWSFGLQTNDWDFQALLVDWENNRYGRHVYPGLGAYRMSANDGGYPSTEIVRMVDSTRAVASRLGGALGNVYFRYGSLHIGGYWNTIVLQRYNDPALVPQMPWKDNVNPSRPDSFKIVKNISTATLSWRTPPGEPVRYYVVYQSLTLPMPFDDPFFIYSITQDTTMTVGPLQPPQYTTYYAVTALDRLNNESHATRVWGVSSGGVVVGVEEQSAPVERFSLSQNYPNPFNPATIISYSVPGQTRIRIRVYDMLGREVQTLQDGTVERGFHQAMFDGTALPSGVYLYRLEAAGFAETRKMLLLR